MATRREFPIDPITGFAHTKHNSRRWAPGQGIPVGGSRPLTDIEAIMRLSPHQESTTPSLMETMALKEAVGAAIEALEPEDAWIINALFVEQLSLRTAGRALGIPKTSLARRRDYIREQLMVALRESPNVKQWLNEGSGLGSFHALA